MSRINHRKVKEIGKFLYKDDFGKLYIINSKKNGFLVLEKDDQRIFQLLRLRVVFSIMVGFVADYYIHNLLISVLIGVGIFGALQAYYLLEFLPKLGEVESDIDLSKKRNLINTVFENNLAELIKKAVISLVVFGVFLYNMIDLKLSLSDLVNVADINAFLSSWLYILVIASTFFMLTICVIGIVKKRKEKK